MRFLKHSKWRKMVRGAMRRATVARDRLALTWSFFLDIAPMLGWIAAWWVSLDLSQVDLQYSDILLGLMGSLSGLLGIIIAVSTFALQMRKEVLGTQALRAIMLTVPVRRVTIWSVSTLIACTLTLLGMSSPIKQGGYSAFLACVALYILSFVSLVWASLSSKLLSSAPPQSWIRNLVAACSARDFCTTRFVAHFDGALGELLSVCLRALELGDSEFPTLVLQHMGKRIPYLFRRARHDDDMWMGVGAMCTAVGRKAIEHGAVGVLSCVCDFLLDCHVEIAADVDCIVSGSQHLDRCTRELLRDAVEKQSDTAVLRLISHHEFVTSSVYVKRRNRLENPGDGGDGSFPDDLDDREPFTVVWEGKVMTADTSPQYDTSVAILRDYIHRVRLGTAVSMVTYVIEHRRASLVDDLMYFVNMPPAYIVPEAERTAFLQEYYRGAISLTRAISQYGLLGEISTSPFELLGYEPDQGHIYGLREFSAVLMELANSGSFCGCLIRDFGNGIRHILDRVQPPEVVQTVVALGIETIARLRERLMDQDQGTDVRGRRAATRSLRYVVMQVQRCLESLGLIASEYESILARLRSDALWPKSAEDRVWDESEMVETWNGRP